MNIAAIICPDNLPVKEGLFVLLTNGCPTALLIDMRGFAGNVRFWPNADGQERQLSANSGHTDVHREKRQRESVMDFIIDLIAHRIGVFVLAC
jgi:hypothetical protein